MNKSKSKSKSKKQSDLPVCRVAAIPTKSVSNSPTPNPYNLEIELKITKRQIDAVLRNASFRPSDLGPMRVIMDVGDADYFVTRAQEYLFLAANSPTLAQRKNYLEMSIRLTALALVHYEDT